MERLVQKLKETKKMSNKYLAKRLLGLNKNNNKFQYEDNEINKRLYNLLLDLVDEETKKELLTSDAIIKILSSRIEKESFWTKAKDNSFYYEDIGNHFYYQVTREEDGYNTKHNHYIEQEFLDEYSEPLNIIHLTLLEKEVLLDGNYKLQNEKDRDLAEEIINYLGLKQSEQVKQKVI